MSNKAVTWAFKITGLKSSDKFVLVALADCADAADMAWPSVTGISEMTALNRKTVIKSLDNLEAAGLIFDSGQRKGNTGQVKIYQLRLDRIHARVPETEPLNGTKNGTIEESQKGDALTVPKTEQFQKRNSTKFSTKESQIYAERVPNLGHGTINEPSMNHQREISLSCGDGGGTVSQYVSMAMLFRKAGINTSSQNQVLRTMVDQGVTEEEVIDAIRVAKKSADNPNVKYVAKVVASGRNSASKMDFRKTSSYQQGCMQNAAIAAKKLFGEDYDTSGLS